MKKVSFLMAVCLSTTLSQLAPGFAQAGGVYDGTAPLKCGQTVNCNDRKDVHAKMRARYVNFSSKTPYAGMCREAIVRVLNLPRQVQFEAGIIAPQMEVCNMQ
jgi:hypothetical protein